MRVSRMFIWDDRELVVVHLASFAWDFRLGRCIKLVQGRTTVEARQVGSGNHEGHAMVALVPVDRWQDVAGVLHGMSVSGEPILIEAG